MSNLSDLKSGKTLVSINGKILKKIQIRLMKALVERVKLDQ